jgi:hypothetical protein
MKSDVLSIGVLATIFGQKSYFGRKDPIETVVSSVRWWVKEAGCRSSSGLLHTACMFPVGTWCWPCPDGRLRRQLCSQSRS